MSNSTAAQADVEDRGPSVFAVTTATLALSTLFVAARLISRVGIVRRVGWDDYTIVLAWLLAVGVSVSIDVGTRYGLGKHDVNVPLENRVPLKRSEYVFTVLYNPALMATKTSILIFYLHLAKNIHKLLRLASWVVLILVNLAGTILTLLNILQCRPVDAAFQLKPIGTGARCLPQLTIFICAAPINIVTDLAILALPLPILTGLRLPQRQKIILIVTYTVGIFVTVVDVIRIYYLQQAITDVSTSLFDDPKSLFGNTPEFQWNASLSLMWSAVEVNVGIICACVPLLKPLFIKILPILLIDPNRTPTTSSGTRDNELLSGGTAPGMADTHNPNAIDGGTPQNSLRNTVDFTTQDAFKMNPQSMAPAGDREGTSRGLPPDFWELPDTPERNRESGDQSYGLDPAPLQRVNSSTATTSRTIEDNSVYFGFVNIQPNKNLLRMSVPESFRYCTLVSILVFLWGFSYGLLGSLNNAVAAVSHMSTAQTLGLASTYFSGYFFGPLVIGQLILRYDERHQSVPRHPHDNPEGFGFKATFIVSLCVYGTGAIMFWPCAVLASFPGFIISNFVVGCGLGVLQTGVSPFIVLCGPSEYAEMRLLFAQGFQGIGSVISIYLGTHVLFDGLSTNREDTSTRLLNLQWTYLAITLISAGLAIFFYYIPLPEVSNDELEQASSQLLVNNKKRSVGGLRLQTICLILAVLAQWTFVATYECMSQFFKNLFTAFVSMSIHMGSGAMVAEGTPSIFSHSLIPNYLLVASSVFTISRFLAGGVAYLSAKYRRWRLIPSPRTMLTIAAAGCIISTIVTVSIKPIAHPKLIVVPVMFLYLFEGPMWPLIFALGMRGQGRRTKRAGIWLTMGSSGPAFWLFVMYGIARSSHNIQMAFILNIGLLTVTLIYPLYITFSTDARALVTDPRTSALHSPGRRRSPEDGLSELQQG